VTRIAVVDNDEEILELLRAIFADRAWDVWPFVDGTSALGALAKERPDAIVLDIWLGGPDSGWEILRQLKASPVTRDVPVLVWSGAEDRLREKDAWLAERGILTLSKPFEIDELYEKVEALLASRVPQPAVDNTEG
jgi:DNA-binding response OmpR family regulator